MSKSHQAPKRFSLILATGSALLLSLAVSAATASEASADDTSAPTLWHMGLGGGAQQAAQTPPVGAAPPSRPLLWQMGLGSDPQHAAQTPPVSAAPTSRPLLWHMGLGR